MIVVNGLVSNELKEHLCEGGAHSVARRHGNLIIAGGNFANERGFENLWNPTKNKIEIGAVSSSDGKDSGSNSRLRAASYIDVEPNTA